MTEEPKKEAVKEEAKTIKTMSVVELKAAKCDLYERVQMCNQQISMVNEELSKRS